MKLQFLQWKLYIYRLRSEFELKSMYYYIHFCQSVLIRIQNYVYADVMFLIFNNLPNTLRCNTLI